MGDLHVGVAATVKATFNKLRSMATGIVPDGYRLHPDFAFTFNGWHINGHARREGLVSDRDAKKVRILFDDADKDRLDDCPYMARMGYSMDVTRNYRFCAFMYPRGGETVEQIRDWAAARGFVHISILNRDNALLSWDHARRLEAVR